VIVDICTDRGSSISFLVYFGKEGVMCLYSIQYVLQFTFLWLMLWLMVVNNVSMKQDI